MDRGVIATASELFEGRYYPGVVAMCSDALENEPECVPLLLIRARARMALRLDLDAQADLRDVIRLEPGCAVAYRLLGELAARGDESGSASALFREALRLDPEDREAHDWLQIVTAPSRLTADRLQAPAAEGSALAVRPHATPAGPVRLARGTRPPSPSYAEVMPGDGVPAEAFDDGPTRPFRVVGPAPTGVRTRPFVIPAPSPEPEPWLDHPTTPNRQSAPHTRPSAPRAAAEPRPSSPRPAAAPPAADLPGFGEYLVSTGILTRERLRAAQAYQRSMRVQLSTAIVTLGLASPQRVAWAAVAHEAQLARDRSQ